MKKIFIGNLPADMTEQELTAMFSDYGRVRSIQVAQDIFSRTCRGFGFIEMEGHEAHAAIAALNGKELRNQRLKVNGERPQNRHVRRGRRR